MSSLFELLKEEFIDQHRRPLYDAPQLQVQLQSLLALKASSDKRENSEFIEGKVKGGDIKMHKTSDVQKMNELRLEHSMNGRLAFLQKQYELMIKFGMESSGDIVLDDEIIKVCGDWMSKANRAKVNQRKEDIAKAKQKNQGVRLLVKDGWGLKFKEV